jgi:transposase
MPYSKIELYAAIRRDARAEISARAIERKHGAGRRTIVKAMASPWPEPRKHLPPRDSKLDPFKPVIDEMLRADLAAPRKQRHTVTRIWWPEGGHQSSTRRQTSMRGRLADGTTAIGTEGPSPSW